MNYPDHWGSTTFKSITEEIDKSGPDKNEKFDYIEISSIDRDIKKITDVEAISKDDASSRAKQHLKAGDLLISKVRPKLNGVAIVPEKYNDSIGTTGFYVVRTSDVNTKFLLYFTQTQDFIDSMDRKSTGSSYPSVKITDIDDYQVPVPPLTEQEQIVSKIEKLFSKLESGVNELEDATRRLEQYQQVILNKAITGEMSKNWRDKNQNLTSTLGSVQRVIEEEGFDSTKRSSQTKGSMDQPPSWESATMSELIYSTRYGTSEKCDYEFDGPPVLRIPNIRDGIISFDDMKYAKKDADLSNIDPLDTGDLLMIRTNGSSDLIGRAAVVLNEFDEPHYFASYLIRFRIIPVDPLPVWINIVWNSQPIREKILEKSATSAGQYNLSQTKVLDFELPLPPIEEMREIIKQVNKTMTVTDRVESYIQTEKQRAKSLRQSILKHAFEGKLGSGNMGKESAPVTTEGTLSRDKSSKMSKQKTIPEVIKDAE